MKATKEESNQHITRNHISIKITITLFLLIPEK